MEADLYLAYLLACLVIVIPGPTTSLIIANSVRHGMRAGLLNVAGTQFGLLIIIGSVGLGLNSLLEVMGHWLDWLRLLGAAYLLWLGWMLLRQGGSARSPSGPPAARGSFFVQGCLVAFGNPKILLFFGALIPQFVDLTRPQGSQILIMGATAMAIAVLSDGAYALAAARAGRALSGKGVRLLARTSGGFLIGGGLWLAMAQSR